MNTNDPKIDFCPTCKKNVYITSNKEELKKNLDLKRCIIWDENDEILNLKKNYYENNRIAIKFENNDASIEDEKNQIIIPNLVGRPKHVFMGIGIGQKDSYVGDEIKTTQTPLHIKNLILNGIIDNFDDFEKVIWHLFYNEMGIAAEESQLLFLVPTTSTKKTLISATQCLFETFSVQKICVLKRPVFRKLMSNVSNGIYVFCDSGCMEAIGIIDSKVKFDTGIHQFQHHNLELIFKNLYKNASENFDLDQFYISEDFEEELKKNLKIKVKGKDDEMIELNSNSFEMIEGIFNDKLKKHELTIQQLVVNCIEKFDSKIQKELYSNILLEGNYTRMKGFYERFEKEMKNLRPKEFIQIEKEDVDSVQKFLKNFNKSGSRFVDRNSVYDDYPPEEYFEFFLQE